ncbi:MAG: hypothetical protein JSV20_04045 [Candidatus Bathyarchaeota archaeon]|nr:MAG: hypothetical protein JSV20_04045 [Candidatus Bathyarchaeota archaeon]
MENMGLKIRLSVLWLIGFSWGGVVGMMLTFYEARNIEGILVGELKGTPITQELLLAIAIVSLIPLVMAFLSLTLKDKANRLANIIVGVISTGFGLIELVTNLGKASAYMSFIGVVGLVFPTLIVWYAWKWPKQEAS